MTGAPCERCGNPSTDGNLRRGYCKRCDMQRRARVGYQCSYVDAAPARARVLGLRAHGIGLREIERRTGIARSALLSLIHGRTPTEGRSGAPCARITQRNHDKIMSIEVPAGGLSHRDPIPDGQMVDAIGTIRRLQALVAFGYPRSHLGRLMGWTGGSASLSGNISTLMDPTRTPRVRAATARRVAEIFRQLQMTPGPSARARNEGLRRGWELPFDWDEDELDTFEICTEVAQ